MKKTIVVLTGAGVSAESGIATFRGSGGLWNGYSIEDVATPQGWHANPEMVLEFYNERRKDAAKAEPNAAHRALAKLEKAYDVQVITQNVDDLHERGGSTNVLHLHGILRQVRSTTHPNLVYDIGDKAIKLGDTCEKGGQLRPHIVWFGEAVPMIERAVRIASKADIFIVIGTSLVVYPAASLIHYVPKFAPKYLVDPNIGGVDGVSNLTIFQKKATEGVTELVDKLLGEV